MTLEFIVTIALLLSVVGWAGQLMLIRSLSKDFANTMNDAMDTMSKLAQLGFIHSAAKSPFEAVQASVVLENEIRNLDKAEAAAKEELARPQPKGPPVGFIGPNGRVIKFMTPPTHDLISSIGEKNLVYE